MNVVTPDLKGAGLRIGIVRGVVTHTPLAQALLDGS